ncbi:MAG: hypothetical protein ABL908_07515 [Hyphomicrobium sp.]
MIERPNRTAPNGFGKRGTVTMQRQVSAAAVAAPAGAQEASGGTFQLPKWAIGAVAGVFLLMMVTMSGGIGGGGFLGGLLGGMFANKLMNSGKMPTATAAAPRDAGVSQSQVRPASAHTGSDSGSMTRGGFGTTASSPSHSSGGHSSGG